MHVRAGDVRSAVLAAHANPVRDFFVGDPAASEYRWEPEKARSGRAKPEKAEPGRVALGRVEPGREKPGRAWFEQVKPKGAKPG